LVAVEKAALEKDRRWRRLVDSDVVVVLCGNVLSTKLRNYLEALPSGSKDVRNVRLSVLFVNDIITLILGAAQVHSSFFMPMTILLHAAIKFSDPPDETDLKVVAVLKKYWSMMVVRVSSALLGLCGATLT